MVSKYRIATLLPSATELVAEIGLAESIVCISHECDNPTHITHLPRVTSSNIPNYSDQTLIDRFVKESVKNEKSLYDINLNLLRELDVTHIVTQGICDVCAVSPKLIEANLRGNQCILSSDIEIISLCGTTINGIFDDVMVLSKTFKREKVGKDIVTIAKHKLKRLAKAKAQKRSVLMLEWLDPPYIAGHWVPEQIQAAGFHCAAGGIGDKSTEISWNEIVSMDPDYIGVISCGGNSILNQKYADTLYKKEMLKNTKAVRNNMIFGFDANKFFSRPTLRVIDGVDELQNKFVK